MQQIYSIAKDTETEIVIQKSRFIARLVPISSEAEAKAKLLAVREEHPAANHNVYAYRIGAVERFSDDGEPSGTAGRPVLEVLRRENLDNILAVVTRYFGGILLGAGGLVRAYAQTAKACLDAAAKVCLVPYQEAVIVMDYPWVNKVEYLAGARGYAKAGIEYAGAVRVVYLVPEAEVEEFGAALRELSAGQLEVQLGTIVFCTEMV